MRIMAIDFGDVRIGLAVSDPTGTIAGEAWTMRERNFDRAAQRILDEAAARDVGQLVLGLPKNMDGSEGVRATISRSLKARLEVLADLPVTLWDERRSSVEAHRILHESGKRMKKHRSTVDAVAASLILEGFLGTL